ncbi:hypothetical protein [Bacillus sp. Marseille-P3661]|uniref:hypothetical protein n=1 Tax=Bacillus sp. Marseille-P3661 TaxID=1936234 RepID=UPI000C823E49|nr:hypothetical protein [Bacillus sp. Marseille-P3661]
MGVEGPEFGTDTFSDAEVCSAVQCIRQRSEFFDGILEPIVACPDVGEPCPNTAALETCATEIRALLTEAGAAAALAVTCPGAPQNILGNLNAILRQYLANLLNTCISTNTEFGCVGGVLLSYVVDLTSAQAVALGFDADDCVTVGEILALAEEVLAACGQGFSETFRETLALVLDRMAQPAGATIIEPVFC